MQLRLIHSNPSSSRWCATAMPASWAFTTPRSLNYVARLLCEFSEADKLYKVHDEEGKPIRALEEW
jgi:hypothetical protein